VRQQSSTIWYGTAQNPLRFLHTTNLRGLLAAASSPVGSAVRFWAAADDSPPRASGSTMEPRESQRSRRALPVRSSHSMVSRMTLHQLDTGRLLC
jgi:hypothetical protein